MSNQKYHKMMMKLDKCYSTVRQNSAKGISADEIATKLNIHRTTVYNHLNSLELMGKVENKQGKWYAKTEEQTIKPLEREIVIELPTPKNQLHLVALLELLVKYFEEIGIPELASQYRTLLEALRETRTIKIKGKNVDDLDLEKLGNLIQQAHKKSFKINLKSLFKSLKRQLPFKTEQKPEQKGENQSLL